MNQIQHYISRNQITPKISIPPSKELGLVVVIPCYNEPSLNDTLLSLWECDRPQSNTEIIIVINDSEESAPEIKKHNELTFLEALKWFENHTDNKLTFHAMYCPDLPRKHAGVGLARKIGMDEAVLRLLQANNNDRIIVNLDADSSCDKNYLTAIENHFKQFPKTPGASIYFEHPIVNQSKSAISAGIIQYELHLRYLNQAFRFISHPHAFHTVGSCFAVRLEAYVKQGGMNKRQAGEDFYFIQKIIWLGNFSEINNTKVIPSARVSDRVPFGTGAAMKKWKDSNDSYLLTYNFEAFTHLKYFFSQLDNIFTASENNLVNIIAQLPDPIKNYLNEINCLTEIHSVKQNTASLNSFRNRFFLWFDLFRVIKYLNQSHIGIYNKQPVTEESKKLIGALGKTDNAEDLLIAYRQLDKMEIF